MSFIFAVLTTMSCYRFLYLFPSFLEWNCINNQVSFLLFTDKVFAPTCSNQKVYEEGARDVALSVVSGINGNFFETWKVFHLAFLLFGYISFFLILFNWSTIHLTLQQQFLHMGKLAVVKHSR